MTTIAIGTGTCGVAAGAAAVLAAVKRSAAARNAADIEVRETGCNGMCYAEVLVEVREEDDRYLYGRIGPEQVERLFSEHIDAHHPIEEWLVLHNGAGAEAPFLSRQKRLVLRNCGTIDPMTISDYLATGGYKALEKALDMTPEAVIDTIIASGLRGRGGAGFPTGTKWRLTRASAGNEKYLICNADEGDPGAFMDRSVLESDPHAVLEGMVIGAHAIGAHQGFIYCRAEYPKALVRLRQAIAEAERHGALGDDVLGSGFRFHVGIKEGAGAFVCGEETALIASVEGRRGMPRLRPPYPAVAGLWGRPTCINNVETFANVPWIIEHGAEPFAALGTAKSKGSKVFAMAGKVKRTGLVEVPMGITINEIIFDVCGGIAGDRRFKAVQMGGPSGGCIPAALGDTRIDYDELTRTGAIMGSGGMIVLDDTTCMVEMARFFLEFTQNESCGKCTSCRLGTLRMLEILERIVAGEGTAEDLTNLEELGRHVKATSMCGLGQTAPNPVLTTMRYFRDEYEAHIAERRCPAHSCARLVTYLVEEAACTGCTLCARECPEGAVTGELKKPHRIDPSKCSKCGKCLNVCNVGAIHRV